MDDTGGVDDGVLDGTFEGVTSDTGFKVGRSDGASVGGFVERGGRFRMVTPGAGPGGGAGSTLTP